MEQYVPIKNIGSGTYGKVWLAFDKKSHQHVAIKKLKRKYHSINQCKNLAEVKSLRKMDHFNIVKLLNLFKRHDNVFFVFEYMDCNLDQLIRQMKKRNKIFSEDEVRNWCLQILQGLNHMHNRGYFHRDLKPDNLLVSKDVIKIGDFGMSKEIDSCPPYTDYVTTRWYRAPEVLLGSRIYGPKVDMWAMGAIMAELMTLSPLFPGKSSIDQIYKICRLIGSPTKDSWPDGIRLASAKNWKFPSTKGVGLSKIIPSAKKDAISLMSWLCSWDPCKRPTAAAALQHSFFKACFYVPQSLCCYDALSTTTLNPPVLTRKRKRVVTTEQQVASTCQVTDHKVYNKSSIKSKGLVNIAKGLTLVNAIINIFAGCCNFICVFWRVP